MWSFSAAMSSMGGLSLPPCAAGDCLISSIFCSAREFHPRQTDYARHGVPPHKAVSFIKLLLQMRLPLGRVKRPVTVHAADLLQRSFCQTLGLRGPSSDSGSLADLGQLAYPFLCSMCKMWIMLLPLSCLFGSLVVCQISQLRSGPSCATATEINEEHQQYSLLTLGF